MFGLRLDNYKIEYGNYDNYYVLECYWVILLSCYGFWFSYSICYKKVYIYFKLFIVKLEYLV